MFVFRRSREAESLGSALGDFRQRNRRRVAAVALSPRTALESATTASTEAGLDDEGEGAFDVADEDAQQTAANNAALMNEANSLRHLGIRARNPLLGRASRGRPPIAPPRRKR